MGVTVVHLTDPADPALADFARLTDVPFRTEVEPQRQMFIAEGATVIRRALACGYRMRSVLAEAKWWQQLAPVVPREAAAFEAEQAVLQQLTGYRVHRGALASFARKPLPTLENLLANTRTIAVLEDVNDHTNLGAIFRSAAALGVEAVVLSPRCADPLYRRSIKVSMGAVLALPYTVAPAWPLALEQIAQAGFTVLGLTPRCGAVSLLEVDLPAGQPRALLLGAEGPGLSEQALQRCVPVRIPMPEPPASHANQPVVDSLNVAAAAAIAFHTFTLGLQRITVD